MIIHSLTLENFRQFHGRQRLEFSTDKDRNVTLIYGSNGSGKTTLLNAFTWGLYGTTTDGFDQAAQLISNLAWSKAATGDEVTARVEIEFEDHGKLYTIARVQTARKAEDGSPIATRNEEVTLHVTDETGKNDELHTAVGAINAILPERLHRFVFFDGERGLERLTNPDSFKEAEEAVKTVLGLEIVERAIEDLGATRRRLNSELSDVGTDRDKELNEQIEAQSAQQARLEEELATVYANLAADRRALADVNEELAKTEESRELQSRREGFDQAVTEATKRIAKANQDLDRAVQRDGYLAFIEPLAQEVDSLYEEKRARGQIPAAITMQLVQDLLSDGRCICGTELKDGQSEHEHVTGWLERAPRREVEDSWINVSAQTKINYSKRDSLYQYLDETLAERDSHENERTVWDNKRSEISDQIKDIDSGEVQQLEVRRDQLATQITEGDRHAAVLEHDSKRLESLKANLQRDLEKAEQENERASLARRRLAAVGGAIDVLKRILNLRSEQTRRQLDERIKAIFSKICFRPFVPSLDSTFRLSLSERIGGRELPVAKSTGESQILSLSFVGAVAERARQRYEESQGAEGHSSSLLSFEGGIFPLVLDAVFGNLDDEYQMSAAQALPDLAPQVIIMVSRAQGADAVREALWPRAGKIAVCTLYTSDKGAGDADVATPSATVPYRVEIADREDRTELVEA